MVFHVISVLSLWQCYVGLTVGKIPVYLIWKCWSSLLELTGCVFWPLRACFLVVLRQQWPRPGTGLMSLLLTGGGWSTNLGGRVKQTGSPAALIKIPVMPVKKVRWKKFNICTPFIFLTNSQNQNFHLVIRLLYSPANAGWTGLDPFRFLTGTVGTLKQTKYNKRFRLTDKIFNSQIKNNKGENRLVRYWHRVIL